MAPRKDGRDLLGFDSPLNSTADNTYGSFGAERPRFPNAIQDWSATPRTLRERSMIAFMDSITDKADWTRKVYDEDIVEKWRAEAAELEKSAQPERALTQKMFEYCIAELRDYATAQESSGFVPSVDADAAVYKSDSLIPDELKAELKAASSVLEDVPDKLKDWHPDSNELVLDLVHPSLFPLLYGRSRILREGTVSLDECDKYIGKGEIMPVPQPDHLKVDKFPGLAGYHQSRHNNGKQYFYSERFQWLPCEIAFDDEAVKITSYINNLHPKKHKALYQVLEKLIARVLPMWNATLASTERSRDTMHPDKRVDYGAAEYEEGPSREEDGDAAAELVEEILQEFRDDGRTDAETVDELDEDDLMDLDEEYRKKKRVLMMPEPGDYDISKPYKHPLLDQGAIQYAHATEAPESKAIGLRELFAKEGLQIIIKLANIHLTPEKPKYEGGSWHVEGQLNEHICASALYYYDCLNITDSHLSFREVTSVDSFEYTDYEQDDYEHLERMYEIEQNGPAIQYLGKVNTREGRVVTFPNVLHHRVEPFELADSSQPGHRKILALFLVDPYCKIPSTANVPPQQKEWWREMVQSLDRVGDLPVELAEHVVDSAGDFPIDLEEAKKIRLELMEERKVFVEDVESRVQIESFSFCEH